MTTKLRIMHMLGAAQAGGAETFFIRLQAALAEHPDVDLMPVVREGSWASEQLSQRGIAHRTAPFGGWFDSTITGSTARAMKAHAAEFRPQVIQSWMNRASTFVPQGPWATIGRLGGYYDLKYYRGHVENLVCITQDLCDYCIKEGWSAAKVKWIDNFAATPPQGWRDRRAAMRTQYGIPSNAKALLLAGRLHQVKGVDLTLRAIASLPDDIWVIAAGEGPERDSLQALAREFGVADRVVFTGWVNDISIPAAAADIWLAPSRWEPMGSTVLDAWAHALPLIASKAAGPASLIVHGETGLLVEVGDVDTLRDAIARLTGDAELGERLSSNGHQRYQQRHTKQIIVDNYLAHYRNLIAAQN